MCPSYNRLTSYAHATLQTLALSFLYSYSKLCINFIYQYCHLVLLFWVSIYLLHQPQLYLTENTFGNHAWMSCMSYRRHSVMMETAPLPQHIPQRTQQLLMWQLTKEWMNQPTTLIFIPIQTHQHFSGKWTCVAGSNTIIVHIWIIQNIWLHLLTSILCGTWLP